MIAMLGMYDMPAIQTANDRFWTRIRSHLGVGPDHLTRDMDHWQVWQSPDLLLGQTCGMPFRTRLHPHVTLIGTPDYALPDCPPGYYRSAIIARKNDRRGIETDFSGATLAFNDSMSQSGWSGPILHFQARGLCFRDHLATGSHAASARAVAEGRADLAGLDALTWALLQEHDPELAAQLKVIGNTEPTPGLPYVTAAHRDPAPIRQAIRTAITELAAGDRAALHLRALVDINRDTYLAVPSARYG